MLQNLDYMILLNADISFCMVCKLWYISIRCIFKNLALKLRIYNFRGVCVCLCMFVYVFVRPACHHPTQNTFPSFPLLSYFFHYSSGVRSVCDCVCCLLFASIPIVVDHLLYLFLYSIHYLSFYGSYISIVFKNGSMVLQRTIYDPFLRAILIPNYAYF